MKPHVLSEERERNSEKRRVGIRERGEEVEGEMYTDL